MSLISGNPIYFLHQDNEVYCLGWESHRLTTIILTDIKENLWGWELLLLLDPNRNVFGGPDWAPCSARASNCHLKSDGGSRDEKVLDSPRKGGGGTWHSRATEDGTEIYTVHRCELWDIHSQSFRMWKCSLFQSQITSATVKTSLLNWVPYTIHDVCPGVWTQSLKGKSMSQMRSPGSGIRLTASASKFQIAIQLTFIEQLHLPGDELSASTYVILQTVVKALPGSTIMARVKMRRVSDGLKVIQLSVTDLWLEPGVFPSFSLCFLRLV